HAVSFIHAGIARAAASIARFASARPPYAISVIGSSVAGLMTRLVRPLSASHHFPSMYSFFDADAVAVAMRNSSLRGGFDDVTKRIVERSNHRDTEDTEKTERE